jgi:hypothetical protein
MLEAKKVVQVEPFKTLEDDMILVFTHVFNDLGKILRYEIGEHRFPLAGWCWTSRSPLKFLDPFADKAA